jgi:hypothetical protein
MDDQGAGPLLADLLRCIIAPTLRKGTPFCLLPRGYHAETSGDLGGRENDSYRTKNARHNAHLDIDAA